MGKSVSGNVTIRVAIIIADFVLMNLLLFIFTAFGGKMVPQFFHDATRITVLLANIGMVVAQYFFCTIIHRRLLSFSEVAKNTFCLSAVQVGFLFFTLKAIDLSDGGFYLTMILFFCTEYAVLLISRVIEKQLLKSLRRKGRNSRAVILVGYDPALSEFYEALTSDIALGYRVRGFFADPPFDGNVKPVSKYLGTLSQLREMMHEVTEAKDHPDKPVTQQVKDATEMLDVDEIFCCLSHSLSDTVVDIMNYCDRHMVHFFYIPRQFGLYRLHLKAINFKGREVFTNHREPLENPLKRGLKRAFDIVFSLVACICLLPFIPIIGLIIKLQSPGPIFFCQNRTGLNGRTFKCIKFRSMHVNKDADRVQATEHDARKFPFGDFMRRTNIDELPQFFNVLKGDMSVVGPRPHMLYHTEVYSKLIDKYMVRHFCRPGITGLSQVRGFRGETKELWQMEERVRLDIYYLENWSVLQDIIIIIETFLLIFKHDENAY